ncbi:hypothetical protein HK104_000187 [Borealophlyctis nickersoniae]|nr:hypothetical protein HK104_000187 [Borealophlyctis nickersoniae]
MQKLMAENKNLDAVVEGAKESRDPERQRQAQFKKRAHLIEMYGETGRAKLPSVTEYIEELYRNTEKKFIVFGHHREVLDGISECLDSKLKAKYVRIDGATRPELRQGLCDQFQDDPDTRVAVLGITAAGVGVTLHAADLVLFAELFWNPAQLLQGEDRAHRIGREGNVDIKYLLASGTLDDIQWPLIKRKLDIVGQSIDGRRGEMDTIDSVDRKEEKEARVQPRISGFFSSKGGDGDVLDELVGVEVESTGGVKRKVCDEETEDEIEEIEGDEVKGKRRRRSVVVVSDGEDGDAQVISLAESEGKERETGTGMQDQRGKSAEEGGQAEEEKFWAEPTRYGEVYGDVSNWNF